ncbi:TIGR02444 family protein [Vibrio maerlii]|uniref:TIGR02444 family protein n=1 Tax=Vibrio maerlii TaxID=2231648 RepID=UPI000E3D53CB|nr:TIGR02444 family protein [Vibrio maerlii]
MTIKHARISLTIERLWQFSLQYYSVSEVKEACLLIQNQHHGNVNLLLLLIWLDEQHVRFSSQDWPTLNLCLQRSESLLHDYRELRKQFKTHLPDSVYRKSLQFELQLEKQQQSDLVECINQMTLTNNNTDPLTLEYCRQHGAEHLYQALTHPHPPLKLD